MNWKDMQEEIVDDIGDILLTAAVSQKVTHIVAIVQWQGKQIARIAFGPSVPEVEADGMTILPEPSPTLSLPWREVISIFKTKVNGVYATEDLPLGYYVVADKPGQPIRAVAIPKRYNDGKIAWVNNNPQIEQVEDYLAVAGVLKMTVNR